MSMSCKTPEQCRTHHQKSLKKYIRIDRIIAQLLPDMEIKLQRIKDAQEKLLEEAPEYRLTRRGGNNFHITFLEPFFDDLSTP